MEGVIVFPSGDVVVKLASAAGPCCGSSVEATVDPKHLQRADVVSRYSALEHARTLLLGARPGAAAEQPGGAPGAGGGRPPGTVRVLRVFHRCPETGGLLSVDVEATRWLEDEPGVIASAINDVLLRVARPPSAGYAVV